MNKKTRIILPSHNIKKALTYLVVIVILTFLFKNIFQNWESIKNLNVNFNPKHLLIIFIISSGLHILNSISWHLLTKAIGLNIGFVSNMEIWMLPNLSRYIPGVVWQYIGRGYLLSKNGASKSQGLLSIILDGVLTFSIGAFVVLLSISFFNLKLGDQIEWILPLFITFPIIVTFIFTNQPLLIWLLNLVKRITKKDFKLPTKKFSPGWIIILSFVTFSQFLVAGLVLFLLANGLHPLPTALIPVFAGIYAASWILGYISFFAPGGLGVQELSIAGLLSLFMPLPLASIASLLLRFFLVISEFIVSLVVWVNSKRKLV